MAFSECIFYFLLLEYLNNFSMEEQVFIECYTKGGSSVGPWRGLRPQGALQAWLPCPCRRLSEGDCGDSGPGSHRLLPSRSWWGVGGQRKDGENSSRGAGGGVEGGRNLEGPGASRAFLYAYPLIAVAHVIFLLWNAGTVFTARQAFPVYWHVVSQDFFLVGGGGRAEKRGREKKRHCFFQLRRDKRSNNNIMVTMTIFISMDVCEVQVWAKKRFLVLLPELSS